MLVDWRLQLKSLGVGLASGAPGPVRRNLLPSPVPFAEASLSGWRALRVDEVAPGSA